MNNFTLPANIKQIGSIGTGLRIYMEDYVYTFLHQYATSGGYDERLAYLVGRHMLIDGQSFLFVSGAIYGLYTEKHEGYIRFSQKSAEYADTMLEEHFPGMEIVGWMQSQPTYGTYLNQHYGAYHVRQFTKPYQVLFVMDPLERANAFYTTNPSAITPSDRVTEVGGYFIYYEKNVNMHEYMLSNNAVDYAKPPTFVEFTPVDNTTEDLTYDEMHHNDFDTPYTTAPRITNPEDVIRRHQESSARRRGARVEQKRASGMLAGLCAVLFVVSFVMGVGLIRNQDRIDRMETEIRQLTTAHRNLFAQMSSPEFAPAFAEANPALVPNYGTTPDINVAENLPPIDPPHVPTYVPAPVPPPQVEPPPQTEPQPEPPQALTYSEQEALIPPVPQTYTIQPGDSLIAISVRFFGDAGMVEEILLLNGIEDPNMIVAGTTINLPQR